MRVGIVLSSSPGYSETFLSNKIEGLKRSGLDVTVFLLRPSWKNENGFVSAYPIRPVALIPILASWAFVKCLFTRPSVLASFVRYHRHQRNSLVNMLIDFYRNTHILTHRLEWIHFEFATFSLGHEHIAGIMGAKMAVSLRGFDIGIYPLRHPGCYRKLWARLGKVHVISDDLYGLAIADGLSKDRPWKKITPALPMDNIPQKVHPGSLSSPVRILSIGRLEWKKGFEYAFPAMRLLKKEGIPFTYTIIGDGSQREQLMYALEQLDLKKEVRLLGKLNHEQTMEYLVNSDIYVQPSVQEGFCNSVLEAQACGLLCVASDAEGLSENILHNKTGWIFPRRDVQALKALLVAITRMDEPSRKVIAKNAIDRARRDFRLEDQIDQFVEFFS